MIQRRPKKIKKWDSSRRAIHYPLKAMTYNSLTASVVYRQVGYHIPLHAGSAECLWLQQLLHDGYSGRQGGLEVLGSLSLLHGATVSYNAWDLSPRISSGWSADYYRQATIFQLITCQGLRMVVSMFSLWLDEGSSAKICGFTILCPKKRSGLGESNPAMVVW